MFNEKFFLALAFFAFVFLVKRYAWPLIAKNLDNKSQKIAEDILAAKDLREKAEKILARAELQYQESLKSAEKILAEAEIEVQKFLADSQKLLEAEIDRKTTSTLERIKVEESVALREIKEQIVISATKIFTENLKNIDNTSQDRLIDKAIEDFSKII